MDVKRACDFLLSIGDANITGYDLSSLSLLPSSDERVFLIPPITSHFTPFLHFSVFFQYQYRLLGFISIAGFVLCLSRTEELEIPHATCDGERRKESVKRRKRKGLSCLFLSLALVLGGSACPVTSMALSWPTGGRFSIVAWL